MSDLFLKVSKAVILKSLDTQWSNEKNKIYDMFIADLLWWRVSECVKSYNKRYATAAERHQLACDRVVQYNPGEELPRSRPATPRLRNSGCALSAWQRMRRSRIMPNEIIPPEQFAREFLDSWYAACDNNGLTRKEADCSLLEMFSGLVEMPDECGPATGKSK